MPMQFQKAERRKAKLRLVLSGVSGSGKTYGALMIAKGIGGKIGVVDTEHKSAALYADLVDFDTLQLDAPYSPERYIEAIHAAEAAGYNVLILDSITHEWNGTGGVLEIVDAIAKAKYKGNNWAAWSEGTPRHRKFVEAMLGTNMHIIATIRSKAAYIETEDHGKKSIKKLGTAPEQRDGMEYEFTTMLELTRDGNYATASKDRTRIFKDPVILSEETGKQMMQWLESGVMDPEEEEKKGYIEYLRNDLMVKLETKEDIVRGMVQGRALESLPAKTLKALVEKLEAAWIKRQDDKKTLENGGRPVIRCEMGNEELTDAEIGAGDNREQPIDFQGKKIKYLCTKCYDANIRPIVDAAANQLGGTVVEQPKN